MIPFPDKKYNIIYADPAWRFIGWAKHTKDGKKRGDKSPSNHYKVQSLDWIKNLPVNDLADKNCLLFMWATYPILEKSFEVIKSWGFEYSTVGFTWVKTTKNNKYFFGLGYYTRANPEICLIARKGKPKRISKKVPNLVVDQIREHSRKPDCVRDRIVELCGDLPRIELFARQRTEGWDSWGIEI